MCNGLKFYGRSKGRLIHPIIEKAYDSIPTDERSPYHKKCADTDAMSQVLFQYEKLTGCKVTTFFEAQQIFQGAKIRTAKSRPAHNPMAGQPEKPCESCEPVLRTFFGIEHIE